MHPTSCIQGTVQPGGSKPASAGERFKTWLWPHLKTIQSQSRGIEIGIFLNLPQRVYCAARVALGIESEVLK